MEVKNKWKYHVLLITVVILMNFFSKYVINGFDYFLASFKFPGYLFSLLFFTVFFTIYFINFYFVCPFIFKKNKIQYYIGSVLVIFILYASLRYILEEVILYHFTGMHNYGENSRRPMYYFFDNTYFALKAVLYSTILYLAFRFINNKNKIHQLELDHKKAEINYLKSQISPHFLFNTLNAFYVDLIDDKPETAKDIFKLSELLRFVTYESQEDTLALKNEIKFLEDYIYFYYKRFENELFVDFKVTGSISNQKIPSLILIHFVENVFKHGIINDKNNPVKIQIAISDNYIELNTQNKFVRSEKYTSQGIGKNNIERRLTALFKANYELEYSTKNDYFSTHLKMPLQENDIPQLAKKK